MRFLHPIAAHEKFVARGSYRLFTVGAEAGLYAYEHWTIHEVGEGGQFIRIDRAPLKGGVNLLVEAFRTPQGDVERFDARQWITELGASKKEMRLKVMRDEDKVMVMRRINQAEYETLAVNETSELVLSPQGWLFVGDAVLQAARRGSVAVLALGANFFSPTLKNITAHYEHQAEVMMGTKPIEARCYALYSNHDDEVKVWVDKYDIPLKFTQGDEIISAELFNYAHR
jgi:hypothetical protein